VSVFTVGHGTRTSEELVAILKAANVRTLIDVRRFPGSRRNPQFNVRAIEAALDGSGIDYRHEVELGGRLSNEPGEELFPCIRVEAFRSYAARMRTERWQEALRSTLEERDPCFMCSETPWWRCHRRLIAELLHARGERVIHLMAPDTQQDHQAWSVSEARNGKLYLCGELVA
jgi:uncharacterized protein (DUF488 family)